VTDAPHREPLHRASVDRIATVPNLLSLIRILLIPVFVVLLLHHGTEEAGLLLLGGVVATDWVDGYIARRTGQVSNLGKLLDPIADRLALISALIALVVRHAFPLWAALAVIVRDAAILVTGLALLAKYRLRLDVRWIGKLATLCLMFGIPMIAWGSFHLLWFRAARDAGWALFLLGIVTYYAAGVTYAVDIARSIGRARHRGAVAGTD
jgi:cardiolipin synthase (CMP-forming)